MFDLEPRAANGQMVALAGGRVTPRPHLLAHVAHLRELRCAPGLAAAFDVCC